MHFWLIAGLLSAGCTQDSRPVSTATPVAPNQAEGLQGEVVERLDVQGYTYLRLATAGGESWVAIPTNPVAVGASVNILNPMTMEKFHSKSLNRTFERIYFGTLAGAESTPAAPAPQASMAPVERASGPDGHTIAELFRDREKLKGHPVLVRGVVVKVSEGILDRNWLHLQDGSGSPDLVVTTKQSVKMNEQVTIQGKLEADKDIGSGYRFEVIVQDAKVL